MAESCAGCRFFRRAWTDATHGNCRRSPPAVVANGNSFFPEVGEHDWCGEYEAKICPAELHGSEFNPDAVTRCALPYGHDGNVHRAEHGTEFVLNRDQPHKEGDLWVNT